MTTLNLGQLISCIIHAASLLWFTATINGTEPLLMNEKSFTCTFPVMKRQNAVKMVYSVLMKNVCDLVELTL